MSATVVPVIVISWGHARKSLSTSGALSALVIGFILTIDLALGKINIINLINGAGAERAGRGIFDPLYDVLPALPHVPVPSTDMVFGTIQQITEAIDKFENRNNPRNF